MVVGIPGVSPLQVEIVALTGKCRHFKAEIVEEIRN